ncbi:MAG: GDCCVxC domain-containing (seleno)protein [Candidatus Methylumidiphilus sp.]
MMDNKPLVTQAILTCPVCRHGSVETMPFDACLYFWECPGCHTLLKPRSGDCCVFCSYGDTPCPPVQTVTIQQHCCSPSQ